MKEKNKQKNKKNLYICLIVFGIVILILVLFAFGRMNGKVIEDEKNLDQNIRSIKEFNDCLAKNGMIIYGSNWCPACKNIVNTLGGYEAVENLYVNCDEKQQRCYEGKKTIYVPEIQINGEVYWGQRTLAGFSQATGCPLPK